MNAWLMLLCVIATPVPAEEKVDYIIRDRTVVFPGK